MSDLIYWFDKHVNNELSDDPRTTVAGPAHRQDGRLAVRAEAVCKFRVLRGTQQAPYSRADVAILPDAEEVCTSRRSYLQFPNPRAARAACGIFDTV